MGRARGLAGLRDTQPALPRITSQGHTCFMVSPRSLRCAPPEPGAVQVQSKERALPKALRAANGSAVITQGTRGACSAHPGSHGSKVDGSCPCTRGVWLQLQAAQGPAASRPRWPPGAWHEQCSKAREHEQSFLPPQRSAEGLGQLLGVRLPICTLGSRGRGLATLEAETRVAPEARAERRRSG